MLKVTVGVCKKLGMPNYSSVGASCTLELELDNVVVENPADFLAQMRAAYSQVRKAVDEELDRQRPADPEPEPARENGRREPEREREPAGASNGHAKERNRWGNGSGDYGRERAPYRAPRSEPRGRDDRGRSQGPRDGGMPRTGRQLIKWTKDKDEQHPNGNGLWQSMLRWAKDQGWETRVSEWSFDQVKDAVDFVYHYLGITEDPE